jgi:subtilisin family serine protease
MLWLPDESWRRTIVAWGCLLTLPLLIPSRLGSLSLSWLRGVAGPGSARASTPDSRQAHLPDGAGPDLGQILSQLGVADWHKQGYRGQGLTIAVLDSGFRGYRAHLGKSLPAHVTVRSFRTDGNLEARDSQHGILCGEVLHTLAPAADLLFANWEADRPDQFLDAVRWARRQGARIMSCSLIMPSWSDGEGGGPVNEALAEIIGAGTSPGDLLCFASAGNTAQRHWQGLFHDAGARFHEWSPGRIDNGLTPWGNDEVSVEMCWQPSANYLVLVRDASTGQVVGKSPGHQGRRGKRRRCCAVVRFMPQPGHLYQVRVQRLRAETGRFHLVVLGGCLACATAQGSIACPADGPAVIAVGAVDRAGLRVCYSSCGPNSHRPKPDFVATVPFPSQWRRQPFTGTSAAAPQAAALAALLWSRFPLWNAHQVRSAMQESAQDLGPAGHDYETGYGLIRLPRTILQPDRIIRASSAAP